MKYKFVSFYKLEKELIFIEGLIGKIQKLFSLILINQ